MRETVRKASATGHVVLIRRLYRSDMHTHAHIKIHGVKD